jgi:spore coat polysaccharide biosynthesis protein SpsF
VVKIPSDCPLIDPSVIDRTIDYFVKNRLKYDYVSNLHPPTYPDGNDVEVFSFNALYLTNKFAEEDYEREHTTPYMWSTPGKFRIGNVEWERGLDYSLSHRFVLDYREDYEFIREVFEILYYADPYFTLDDILDLLYLRRQIWEINAHLRGISWYSKFAHDPRAFKLTQRNNNRTINGINTGKDSLALSKVI